MDQSSSDSPAAPESEHLDDENAGLGLRHEPGLCEGPRRGNEEERAEYQRRFDDYTQTLLCDFHADPDRLIAVVEHHRAAHGGTG